MAGIEWIQDPLPGWTPAGYGNWIRTCLDEDCLHAGEECFDLVCPLCGAICMDEDDCPECASQNEQAAT